MSREPFEHTGGDTYLTHAQVLPYTYTVGPPASERRRSDLFDLASGARRRNPSGGWPGGSRFGARLTGEGTGASLVVGDVRVGGQMPAGGEEGGVKGAAHGWSR